MFRRRTGFTLIELLVVIAIIGLLMSIMMPALTMAKKLAKDTMCMARLRQWGLVFHIYLEENNGKFPPESHFTRNKGLRKLVKYKKRHKRAPEPLAGKPSGGDGHYSDRYDDEYYDEYTYSEMFYCPSARKIIEDGGKHPFATFRYANSSYGLNLWLGCWGGGGRGGRFKHYWFPSRIKHPEEIPMFMDCFYDPAPDDCDPTVYHWDSAPKYDGQLPYGGLHEMWRVCMNRHSGGINCTFRDFSARKVGLKELWEIKWSADWFTDPIGNPDYKTPIWPEWMKKFKDYR